MGTYGLDGVIRAWERERITADQAIGQLLQLLEALHQRVADLEHVRSQQHHDGAPCGCQSKAADCRTVPHARQRGK